MNYKFLYLLILFTLLMYACQQKINSKTTDHSSPAAIEMNTAILAKLEGADAYVYKSDKGVLYRAYYQTEQNLQNVVIQTPEKLLILPQKEAWAKGALYKNESISWEAQADQITYKTPEQIERLHQVSPLVKNYENDRQQIKITTTLENNENYIMLERKDAPNIKLKQKDDASTALLYSNDSVQWKETDRGAILTINGIENRFEQKK